MRLSAQLPLFVIVASCAAPAYAFLPIDRWQTTASGPASSRGDPITLTWSLVPDGTPLTGGGASQLVGRLDSAFGVTSAEGDLSMRPWFPVVADSFGRWSELGGLTLRYEPADDGRPHRAATGELGVRGDIRLAAGPIDGIGNVAAASEYPNSGDIWLDAADLWHAVWPRVVSCGGTWQASRGD